MVTLLWASNGLANLCLVGLRWNFSLMTPWNALVGVKGLTAAVLTHNLQVRDKQNIIRTFFDLYGAADPEWVKAATKAMDRLGKCNNDRNIVAHTAFAPKPNGDVEFFIVKAKGRLQLPEVIWTQADFDAKETEMEAVRARLEELVEDCLKRKDAATPRARNALIGLFEPSPDSPAPGLLSALEHQHQEGLDAPAPNPSRDTQTHQAPPER
jgi:hypothetical protein